MVKNCFKIKKPSLEIGRVISDGENSIRSKDIVGDFTLMTKVGYLGLNIDFGTMQLASLDGFVGKVKPKTLKIEIKNRENGSLILDAESKTFGRGIGYDFDFSGDVFYDENSKCLLVGKTECDKQIKLGENVTALLKNSENDNYALNGIFIDNIELKKICENEK